MSNREFADLGALAAHIARVVPATALASIAARGLVAQAVVDQVKHRIGDEQLLPPPLAASTQDERERLGFSRTETLLRTGKLRDSYRWSHISPRETIAGSDDPVALWQEEGVDGAGRDHAVTIPGRYPLRRTMAEYDHHFGELFAETVAISLSRLL